jgi:hypothetical protein
MNSSQCDESEINSGGCKWIPSDATCRKVVSLCSEVADSKNACETAGAVIDADSGEVRKCFYFEDGKCYGEEQECENYNDEKTCLTHTEFKCIPSQEGCRCACVYLCYVSDKKER